jgi:hypothetical protein
MWRLVAHRRVEEQIRIALLGQRAAPEGLNLGIEGDAHPADLASADRGDPQGVDERASTRSSTRRVETPRT